MSSPWWSSQSSEILRLWSAASSTIGSIWQPGIYLSKWQNLQVNTISKNEQTRCICFCLQQMSMLGGNKFISKRRDYTNLMAYLTIESFLQACDIYDNEPLSCLNQLKARWKKSFRPWPDSSYHLAQGVGLLHLVGKKFLLISHVYKLHWFLDLSIQKPF